MKKIIIFLVSLTTLYFVFCNTLKASSEFSTDINTTYELHDTGITKVTSKVILTNLTVDYYAKSYSVILNSINPENIKVFSEDSVYPFTTSQSENTASINIEFPDQVVGKNKSRIFYISYNESALAVRTGEIWEVTIPRISDNAQFGRYDVTLVVPDSLGQEAYISPSPIEFNAQDGYKTYKFSKNIISKTGVTAGFGQFQVFAFSLNYHLENPLNKRAKTEITYPPDTAYQKVYYENISPRPNRIYADEDGNWIGEYELAPRQRIDVLASGKVQVFSDARTFMSPSEDVLSQNLAKTSNWDTSNYKIIDLAKTLKTPRQIYDYVTKTLSYDYSRVRPNVERLGAVNALNIPSSAICMEFTDLFIAIARSAGIPAREINGFAYTENPVIQPLSLVSDVLHSWPEYYDYEKKTWIPVDPTWGSTTGGVDYFSKLDLRHFAFVIHGKSDNYPYPAGSYKLGSNPQKDVFVSFGNLPQNRNPKISVEAKLESWIPLISNRLDIKITNSGPSAMYDIKPRIYFDDVERPSSASGISLLPFEENKSYIEIPFSFLGTTTPVTVKVVVDDQEVIIPTNKNQVVIYNLLFIFIVATLILVTIMFRIKKWKLPKKIF